MKATLMKIFQNMSPRQIIVFISLLLSITTLAVYWQVHDFGFVSFDDTIYVSENKRVQQGISFDNLIWAFSPFKTNAQTSWHPLTTLSHMLDCQMFDLNPGAHHLVNLFIHIINVNLLFLSLYLMTKAPWKSGVVAALFALHPINVDSVAWVAERKNLLSTMFWILTMLAYIRYARKPGIFRYLLTTCALTLGLLSKSMLVTLPCALLLLDFWPLGRIDLGQKFVASHPDSDPMFQPSGIARLVMEKIPFLALSVGTIILTMSSQQLGNQLVDAAAAPMNLRIENAIISYVAYLWKMIWPTHLAVFYPFPKFIPLLQTIGATLFLLAISALIFARARKSPWLVTGWLWYLGTLLPVIGLVQGGLWPALADRWAYVPFIGIFIIIAWGVPEFISHRRLKQTGLVLMAAALLCVLSIMTWIQAGHWKNSQTLFKHALTVTSDNHIAHNNLGNTFFRQSRSKEAIYHFTQAIQIKPDYAEAHFNLANALKVMDKNNKAVKHYLQAIALRPNYEKACNNLAILLQDLGRTDEAITYFKRALLINPHYAQAQYNLAKALKNSGGIDAVINHYLQAIQIRPDDEQAHHGLAMALISASRFNEAFIHYHEALKINPYYSDAHYNLANALKNQGQLNKAIHHYNQTIDIQPENEKAHHNLATVLMSQGRVAEAIPVYLNALKINPKYVNARYNLGIAYFNTGNTPAAVKSFKKALRLNPNADHIQAALDQVMGKKYKNFE